MKKTLPTLTAPVVAWVCAAFTIGTLSGCANMNEVERGTAQGAGIGAVAGALIGAATGGSRGAATGVAVGGALGAVGGNFWSQRMQDQRVAMEKATVGTGVVVSQTADNRLKLDIPSDVSFAVGSAAIQSNFSPVLTQFAATLNQHPATTVTIIGHTDSTGTDAINNPLSFDRANATRDYLIGRGVAAGRIATDGRGSREPIADNSTVQGRNKNRRVEIYVAEKVASK